MMGDHMPRYTKNLQDRPEKMADSPEFLRIVEAWDPLERPVHCSNCAHAIVTGDGMHIPEVACRFGHGAPRSFWQLTRVSKPVQFRPALDCPDFCSMSDEL